MKKIRDFSRALARAVLGIAAAPVVVGAIAAQRMAVGPVFGDYTTVMRILSGKISRRLFGMKVVVNESLAPLVRDRPVWFVANHVTGADGFAVGSTLKGSLVGRAEVLRLPFVRMFAKAFRMIGVHRANEHNARARGDIIKNFNSGFNAVMFPEAHVNKGNDLYMFHAGLFTPLFGEKGVDGKGKEVSLQKEVVVQPVAIGVRDVNGVKATPANDLLRKAYGMRSEGNTLKRIWKRMMIKSITIELTALPPLKPADFRDAKELINRAAQDIANVVNPGQTVFRKARFKKSSLPALAGKK
jgi:1-acyl-sn-glycerol-3-phosphate acyltransferase